ncbi:uncharacterized protein HGUI_00197 [Hanseniaspora guilliermondii]|uniref:Uncharacterized protein n=1 Tax=Hanseniaspora guilliermondii TaxID=56406 RepID=A0A1L0CGZ2_9ASCO|nr:uncharacterized protein HGUI_00197 [Hanseniaspora guilliermondii]
MNKSDDNKSNWLGQNMFIPRKTSSADNNITTSLSKLDNYLTESEHENMSRGRGRSRSISESDFSNELFVPKNNSKNANGLLNTFFLGASQQKRSNSLSASRDNNILNHRRLSDSFTNPSQASVSANVSALGFLNFKNINTKNNDTSKLYANKNSNKQPKLSDLLTNALNFNKLHVNGNNKSDPSNPPKKTPPTTNNKEPSIPNQSMDYSNTDKSFISSTTSTKVDLPATRALSQKFDIDYVGGSLADDDHCESIGTPNLQNPIPTEFEQLCENSGIMSEISSDCQLKKDEAVINFEDCEKRKPIINGHIKKKSINSQDLQYDLLQLEYQQKKHQRQRSLRLVQSVNDLQPSCASNSEVNYQEEDVNGMGIIGYTYADVVDNRMSHISNFSNLSWEEVPLPVRDAHKRLTSNENPPSTKFNTDGSISRLGNNRKSLRKAKSSRALIENEEEEDDEYINAEMQLNLLKQQQVELKMKQMELQIQELKLTNDKLRYAMNDQRQIQDKMIYETLHDTIRTKESLETQMNRKVDNLELKINEYKAMIAKLTDQNDHLNEKTNKDEEQLSEASSEDRSFTPKSSTALSRTGSLYVKKNRLSKIDPHQLEEMTKSRNTSRIEDSTTKQITPKRMSTISSASSSTNGGNGSYIKKKGVNLNLPIRVDSGHDN